MATIVPTDDQPRGRGVSRVFHDVPTQGDLDAVEQKLSAVRKNRNGLAVFVVLLFGMLIAAVAGLAWTFQQQGANVSGAVAEVGDFRVLNEERTEVIAALGIDPAPAAGRLDEAVEAKVAATNTQIADLNEELEALSALRADMVEYQAIHTRRVEAANLKAEIEQLLAQPIRAQVPNTVSLTTYRSTFAPWKEDIEARLLQYVNNLRTERDAILAWTPRAANEPGPQRPREPVLP